MNKYERDHVLYEDLVQATKAIEQYYDVDKIKSYAVYVWTKTGGSYGYGENVFDIEEDEITFWVQNHKIPEEVMPIIKDIQLKLKAIRLNWEAENYETT